LADIGNFFVRLVYMKGCDRFPAVFTGFFLKALCGQAAVAATALSMGGTVFAASEAKEYFSISEQPVDTALLQFAQQAEVSVLFPRTLFAGMQANRLEGEYELREALDVLLANTGIEASIENEAKHILIRVSDVGNDVHENPGAEEMPIESKGKLGLLASAIAALISNGAGSAVYAQTPDDGNQALEEITVTGSRIRQTSGMTTAVPVTAVTTDELKGFQPAATISEQLDSLPQFFQTQTAQRGGGTLFGDASGSYLNLRGMGKNRTLVLLDGSRTVPADRQGAVNVDNFPTALIRTVDVVTGGASAAYGADAMAGVVNFVLDREFEGLKFNVSTGVTEMGDGGNWNFSLAGGRQFGDRLHLIGSIEAREVNEIYREPTDLDNWASIGWVTNPAWYRGAPAGIPQRLTLPNVHSTMHTPAGMINQPDFSLDRFTFTEDGAAIRPFVQGDVYSWGGPGATNTQSGGPEAAIANRAFDGGPSGNAVAQHSTFTGFRYDASDNLELFGQAIYGRTVASSSGRRGNPHLQDGWHGTIYADNAFLPEQVRQAMRDEGIESFRFDKLGQVRGPGMVNWLDDRGGQDTSRMWSLTAGFNAALPNDWNLRGSYQQGKSRVVSAGFNMQRIDKLYLALDAVRDPATGAIVCNVQLHNPTPAQLAASVAGQTFLTTLPPGTTTVDSPVGPDNVIRDCVPLNPFGLGNTSQAVSDYIGQDKYDHRTLDQDFAELLLTGDLAQGFGAGPIGFAGGFTYREEAFLQYSTPEALEREPGEAPELGIRGFAPGVFGASRGLVQFSNSDARSGEFDVWEIFGELNVPLWASTNGQALGTNLAWRSSDYSSSGRIESWKLGADFTVVDGLRLRLTKSRDVREPTFAEQFVTLGGGGTFNDPVFANASVTTTVQSGGNPNLAPEQADTLTAGFVYQPSFAAWIDGLSLAVDWYDIDLFGAVGSLGAQRIVDECYNNHNYCSLITRNPDTGQVQRIIDSNQNVAAARTRGVDIELQYRMEPDFFRDAQESLNLRGFAGYLMESSTTPLAGTRQDEAGTLNRPEWTATLVANYAVGPYGVRLQQRYYDSTRINVNWVEGVDVDDNSIASQSITNLALSYTGETESGGVWQASFNVNNLFDREPPVVPSIGQRGPSQTVSNNFDVFGRRYQLSFDMSF